MIWSHMRHCGLRGGRLRADLLTAVFAFGDLPVLVMGSDSGMPPELVKARDRRAMPTAIPKIQPRRKREPLTRSQIMARIRSNNTRPEILTRAAVHALCRRFRNHVADLPGKPDLANKARKWAIFVHGCFWHSHRGCRLASSPKSNAGYWTEKLAGNCVRDKEKVAALRSLGFRVLIVWECDIRNGVRLSEALEEFFWEAASAEPF